MASYCPQPGDEGCTGEAASNVLDISYSHGFPQAQPRGGHGPFDQQLAIYLYEQMSLVPAEATVGGVWSFMSLVLLPDVAAWRYPDRHRQRFIGSDTMVATSNRHVFGRLWARSYIFGSDLLPWLVEDNFEAIFGRPVFGGNIRVARAIAATMVRSCLSVRITNSQKLLREAMKRIRPCLLTSSYLTDWEGERAQTSAASAPQLLTHSRVHLSIGRGWMARESG